jgi:hypothetical protein
VTVEFQPVDYTAWISMLAGYMFRCFFSRGFAEPCSTAARWLWKLKGSLWRLGHGPWGPAQPLMEVMVFAGQAAIGVYFQDLAAP